MTDEVIMFAFNMNNKAKSWIQIFGNNFLTLKTTVNSFLSVNMFIESRVNSLIQPQAQLSKHIIFKQSVLFY